MNDVNGYQRIANAIVSKAVDDYRLLLKHQYYRPNSKSIAFELNEIEKFFRSKWFSVLTSLDPDWLIAKLKEDVKNLDDKRKCRRKST